MSRRGKIIAAAAAMPRKKLLPSVQAHFERNNYNCIPGEAGRLTENAVEYSEEGCCECCCKAQHLQVFRDTFTASNWVIQPWWLSVFHKPWKNFKLIAHDHDVTEGALGSSEIIIPKSAVLKDEDGNLTINCSEIVRGSYNYRTRGARHFFADVLPSVLYCKCIGKGEE